MEINNSVNVSNFDFEVQLDISQPTPKAIITDISTYIGSGKDNIIGIVVRIIDPRNLALPQTTYPPNVDIQPGLTSTQKNLPYFNGKVSWGTYSIYATLIDQDGTQYEWVGDDGLAFKAIDLCQPNSLSNAVLNYGGLNLNVDPNCDKGLLIVQDGGTGFAYNGVSPSETVAALTVTYPIDTTGTVAQSTATFIPFTFPLTLAGFYTIQGTVTQTYQLTSTTSVKAAYYYQKTFDVQCGYTLCKALCDYEKLEASVTACSTKNPNEAMQQFRTLLLVVTYLGKIAWFKQCGKNFGNILEKLGQIAGFACNCECAPQGIAPAPLFMGSGTITKGNECGDISMELTQFMGNIQLNLSDVSYSVIAAASQNAFVTVTPTEGVCSKTFQISIDVCAMLGTVSIGCLEDVNLGSPAPTEDDVLIYNEVAGEWQAGIENPSWVDITLSAGWANAGGNRQTAQVRKWKNGKVEIRGDVVSSNFPVLSTITTFAATYRPAKTQHFPANVNNLGTYFTGELQTTSTGELSLNCNTLGSVIGTVSLNSYYYVL